MHFMMQADRPPLFSHKNLTGTGLLYITQNIGTSFIRKCVRKVKKLGNIQLETSLRVELKVCWMMGWHNSVKS